MRTDLSYTYEVKDIDLTSRVMLVEYTYPEYSKTLQVSMPLPIEGEEALSIIRTYAPTRHVIITNAPISSNLNLEVGSTGEYVSYESTEKSLVDVVKDKLNAVALRRAELEIAGVSLGGFVIDSDPTSQSKLNSVYTLLKDSLVESVNWKCRDSKFITLDNSNILSVVGSVLEYVQNCFNWEKTMSQQIYSIYDDENLTDQEKINQINSIELV